MASLFKRRAADQAAPCSRVVLNTAALVAAYKPVLGAQNKKFVYDLCCNASDSHPQSGQLIFSRYQEIPLPPLVPVRTPMIVDPLANVYDYAPFLTTPPGPAQGHCAWKTPQDNDSIPAGLRPAVEWHVNFADTHLFGYYGGTLFAQDEMQVAEHPALASLAEWLKGRAGDNKDKGSGVVALEIPGTEAYTRPLTRQSSRATPCLIAGVERRCDINTSASADGSLYGHGFARALQDVVRTRTTILRPPTISNIIAMAAPSPAHGEYTLSQIQDILVTAYTSFRAAAIESATMVQTKNPDIMPYVVIHSGNWGCGAFGNNLTMISVLQLLAARLAGVDAFVYHGVEETSTHTFIDGQHLLNQLVDSAKKSDDADMVKLERVLTALHKKGLKWGQSNGT